MIQHPMKGTYEQSLAFRHMEEVIVVERIVTFMPNQGDKAQGMFSGLMKFASDHEIYISYCRGHSYDNAASTRGRYNGLQEKVKEKNRLAAWILCADHSLNLAGQQLTNAVPSLLVSLIYCEQFTRFH